MKHLLNRHNISLTELSFEARLSRQTIYNNLNKEWPSSLFVYRVIKSINSIAKTKYTISDYFDQDHTVHEVYYE